MFDLHNHLLHGVDDGAADRDTALQMARQFVAEGVRVVACTPHILPGVYANRGSDIRRRVADFQLQLDAERIPLRLVPGADNHMTQGFVELLRAGELLTLADTRYVLVEPPHKFPPPRLKAFFSDLLMAGYVPILTHPERLRWIETHYDTIAELVDNGVWMQLTCGSLTGGFGHFPRKWAQRMLSDQLVHLIASDVHDPERRPPSLRQGYLAAAAVVGPGEAMNLVVARPRAILANATPNSVKRPQVGHRDEGYGNDGQHRSRHTTGYAQSIRAFVRPIEPSGGMDPTTVRAGNARSGVRVADGLRRLFGA